MNSDCDNDEGPTQQVRPSQQSTSDAEDSENEDEEEIYAEVEDDAGEDDGLHLPASKVGVTLRQEVKIH